MFRKFVLVFSMLTVLFIPQKVLIEETRLLIQSSPTQSLFGHLESRLRGRKHVFFEGPETGFVVTQETQNLLVLIPAPKGNAAVSDRATWKFFITPKKVWTESHSCGFLKYGETVFLRCKNEADEKEIVDHLFILTLRNIMEKSRETMYTVVYVPVGRRL